AGLVPRLRAGERVALVSDAGLPAISDPGARVVRAALEAGVEVTVLPGPSAVETALVVSGLVGERYQFLGYLPRGEPALAALWEELGAWPHPAVAFESPRRLPATLRSLAAADPERPVAVCRELTKQFEEIVRGSAAEVAQRLREPPKGEIALVLGPAAEVAPDQSAAVAAVAELVAAGLPRRRAAARRRAGPPTLLLRQPSLRGGPAPRHRHRRADRDAGRRRGGGNDHVRRNRPDRWQDSDDSDVDRLRRHARPPRLDSR